MVRNYGMWLAFQQRTAKQRSGFYGLFAKVGGGSVNFQPNSTVSAAHSKFNFPFQYAALSQLPSRSVFVIISSLALWALFQVSQQGLQSFWNTILLRFARRFPPQTALWRQSKPSGLLFPTWVISLCWAPKFWKVCVFCPAFPTSMKRMKQKYQ